MKDSIPADVLRAALAELRSPEYAVTEQFLSVHEVIPEPAGFWKREDESFELYFPVKGERYYIGFLVARSEGVAKSGWAYTEAASRIYFVVKSQVLEPKNISELLGLSPTYTRKMGEQSRYPNPIPSRHLWFLRDDRVGPFEERLAELLVLLSSKSENLKRLQPHAEYGLSVAYFGYKDQMSGMHLDKSTVQSLADLKLSIDFDLYASGPDLPDP